MYHKYKDYDHIKSHLLRTRFYKSGLFTASERQSVCNFFVLHGCKRYELSQQFVHDILGSGRILFFYFCHGTWIGVAKKWTRVAEKPLYPLETDP